VFADSIVQMLGWLRMEAARASRRKRSRGFGIVGNFFGQKLDGDQPAEKRILRLIHHSRAPAAELS